ncbi:hypothetical protein PROFUN_13334 [Planoprotostelium fungivorum]|uniref:Uncharacterized protein n=1 Tax=Planoprotostelium fungivorum TaxID=1890364 RepID=A0A2P6N4L7_9EUKA|nr:hypothetical protein PROFUN_13334 [Planoprotostelium fungivorum]
MPEADRRTPAQGFMVEASCDVSYPSGLMVGKLIKLLEERLTFVPPLDRTVSAESRQGNSTKLGQWLNALI